MTAESHRARSRPAGTTPFSSRISPRAKAVYQDTPEIAPETRKMPVRAPDTPSSIGRRMSRSTPGSTTAWITRPLMVSTATTTIFARSFGLPNFSGDSTA